jgi:hypothetical protein
VDALLSRVPAGVIADFQELREVLAQTEGDAFEEVRSRVWPGFGHTYWYYYFFGPRHSAVPHPTPESSMIHD